jgi:hypothetical protein
VIPGSAADGIPLLIGAEGDTQALERLPLTPEGRGVYDEAWLQRLIHQNPACLPTAEIEPALDSFSSACCEIPTQRGFIDNLLMTGRGDIAIVEAKLFRNPEARRQALAQALDYSTCLFSMGYAEFEKAALYGPMLRPWRLPASWHIPMCRISRRHGAVMCVRCQLAKRGPSIRMVGRCASLQFSIVLMIGWDRFSGSSPPWQSKMRAADQGRTSRPRY